MPLKAVDVAIGIAFLFLLLTFLASSLVEILATIQAWRALMLHGAVANMLRQSDLVTVHEIFENPLVLALGRGDVTEPSVNLLGRYTLRSSATARLPSYIPA